jgi:hypothetical protein
VFLKHFDGSAESQGAETKMDKLFEAIANNIIVIASFMVPIGIVAVTSYFSNRRLELVHRERMAFLEKGLVPPGDLKDPEPDKHDEEGTKPAPNYLRRGLFWLLPGGGLVAFSLIALQDMIPAIRLPILGVSVICAGIGAAYLVIYMVEQDHVRPGLQ